MFADNMEEARTLVISGKGFMPSEGTPIEGSLGINIVNKQILSYIPES